LEFVITKTVEFHNEVVNGVFLDNMANLEANILNGKLVELVLHMKCQMLKVVQPFFSFLHGFDRKKSHDMLTFMLDPMFKNLRLVSRYLGHENTSTIVVQYDEQLLLPLLIECYKILMPFMCDEEVYE
jgi:hypothetical protein